jgi:hypothetical protein
MLVEFDFHENQYALYYDNEGVSVANNQFLFVKAF